MPYNIDEILHADWSIHHRGRWKAHARRQGDGWLIDDISPVGNIPPFINGLHHHARDKTIWLGLDFPIGLCRHWYQAAHIDSFDHVLHWLKSPAADSFFNVCSHPDQICPHRPFYPARAGAKGTVKRNHLSAGLNVANFNQLHRQCERATSNRPAAATPFWTLGANQVGKGMLHGWQNLVFPGHARGFHLWPFDGDLAALSQQPGVTLIETYPAEIYGWLKLYDMPLPSGRFAKSRQQSRHETLMVLLPRLAHLNIDLSPVVRHHIARGIAPDHGKDDAFDALIGVIGLILIATQKRAENLPESSIIRRQEGWIIGQRETDVMT
tara:strand:+ start:13688 stop:14659 length:972 start_codon:yes stop_codon:yes gene_type:complete